MSKPCPPGLKGKPGKSIAHTVQMSTIMKGLNKNGGKSTFPPQPKKA